MIEWIGQTIDVIAAFFVSATFWLLAGSLLGTWLLARLPLAAIHRPWQSNGWRKWPVVACLVVLVGIWVLWSGQSRWGYWHLGLLPFIDAFGLMLLAAALSVCGAWIVLNDTGGKVQRARQIVEQAPDGLPCFEVGERPLGQQPETAPTGRRIVIFCDGTSNRPDQTSDGMPAPTNVCRLYQDLAVDESQVGWYDPGVATETSSQAATATRLGRIADLVGYAPAHKVVGWYIKFRTIIEAAFGVGITENIVQAYTEIVRQYRAGDHIYLVGFSRGAYTVRCVAGVIKRCGLLRAENIRYAGDVVRLYRTRSNPLCDVPIRPALCHAQIPAIEFVGLFDTVGSLGVPMWGWWFNARLFFRNKSLSTDPAPICLHVYHALAMDERRAQFFPTPFTESSPAAHPWTKTLTQLWFRGAHCDVGGGYAETGLSDIALEWMLTACERHGLVFKGRIRATVAPDPLARLHDELTRQPAWRLLGSWPRWHPVWSELHPSVVTRATAIHDLGRHDLQKIGITPVPFTVEGQREWDRTGLIVEGDGALYRLTWRDGNWRDENYEPCGPSGQLATGIWRRLFQFRRRLPQENYMTLCLSVAHPRAWRLRERRIRRLLRYLFVRDPKEMREQVAPVGLTLAQQGASVLVRNNGPAGILYAFANDLWMTAANNSGALNLTIELVLGEAPPETPLWTLASYGPEEHRAWRWIPPQSA